MNVKQGDTAIVIRCDDYPSNLGIICEVKEFMGTVYHGDSVCNDTWRVVSNGRPFMVGGTRTQECGFFDGGLRPVSGLSDADSIDEQVTKPVAQPLVEEVA